MVQYLIRNSYNLEWFGHQCLLLLIRTWKQLVKYMPVGINAWLLYLPIWVMKNTESGYLQTRDKILTNALFSYIFFKQYT